MRLLTWNLDGLSGRRLDERAEAATFLAVTGRTLRELGRGRPPVGPPPDVLLFQEVVEHTWRAHLRTHLPKAGYELVVGRGDPDREPFEVVAVRRPARGVAARTEPLAGSMLGRELHAVDLAGVPGTSGPVRVLTAHFDSGPEMGWLRVDQLHQVAAAMDARSVFGGDANLRDDEWDEAADDVALTDAWEAVGRPPRLGTTWRVGTSAARFDRVWLGHGLRAVGMRAVGTAKLSPTVGTPSDHVGLVVDMADAG